MVAQPLFLPYLVFQMNPKRMSVFKVTNELAPMCSLFWEGQHRRIALGMVHNRNKSAIGTCIPDVIGIMFFRDMPQQVAFFISEISFPTFFFVVSFKQILDWGANSFVTLITDINVF